MNLNRHRWLSLLLTGGLIATACGDDDGGSPGRTDSGTMDGSISDAGDDAARASSDAAQPSTAVICATSVCDPPELDLDMIVADVDGGLDLSALLTPALLQTLGYAPKACCTEDDDLCGVTNQMLLGTACLQQDMTGEPSDVCPDETPVIDLMGTPTQLIFAGCCKPTNECGVNLGGFGVGCYERSLAAMLVTQEDGGIMMADSIACEFDGS